MPTIDFYLLAEHSELSRLQFVCRLTEKAYKQQHRIYIHADSESMAFQLDEMLWTYRDDSFLPHNLYGEGPEPAPPIQIGFDQAPEKQRDILINLHPVIPSFYMRFSRILELVKNDVPHQALARDHYRFYRAEGHSISTHQLQINEA